MIDQITERYYDIMLSIFMGIVLILILNSFYDSPRVIIIDKNNI